VTESCFEVSWSIEKNHRPAPVIEGEHPVYEVDSILKKRLCRYGRGSRLESLIH
jgi:hypothetical protein